MVNLEAAKVCNHRRVIPKTWKSSLEKKETRLKDMRKRAKDAQDKLRKKIKDRKKSYKERLSKKKEKLKAMREKLKTYQQQLVDKKQRGKSTSTLKKRISLKQKAIVSQKQYLKKLNVQHAEWKKKLRHKLKHQKQRYITAIDKLKYKINAQKETRDYNLTTSLKSYIDPRIYLDWGRQVNYDWKLYYSKALQKKFSWIETEKVNTAA